VWGNYKPCKSAVIVLGRKESRREERRRMCGGDGN